MAAIAAKDGNCGDGQYALGEWSILLRLEIRLFSFDDGPTVAVVAFQRMTRVRVMMIRSVKSSLLEAWQENRLISRVNMHDSLVSFDAF